MKHPGNKLKVIGERAQRISPPPRIRFIRDIASWNFQACMGIYLINERKLKKKLRNIDPQLTWKGNELQIRSDFQADEDEKETTDLC